MLQSSTGWLQVIPETKFRMTQETIAEWLRGHEKVQADLRSEEPVNAVNQAARCGKVAASQNSLEWEQYI